MEDFDWCEICHTNGFHADKGYGFTVYTEAQVIAEEPKKTEGEMFVTHKEAQGIVS